MKKLLVLGLLVLSTNTFAATMSCNMAEENSCVSYSGAYWAQEPESVMQSCISENGTFSSEECTNTDKIGGCLMYEDQPVEYVISFYSPISVDEAKTACDAAGGLWR